MADVVNRWRYGFFAAVLLATSLLSVALQVFDGPLWPMLVLVVTLVVLAALSGSRYRPRRLVLRPAVPAFETPINPYPILILGILTVTTGLQLSEDIRDLRNGDGEFLPLSAGLAAVVLVAWYGVLHVGGPVRLRVNGVQQARVFGSRLVPWDSAGPDTVDSRRAVSLTGVNPEFLDWVIRQYAERPEHRPGIGTKAELGRLEAAGRGLPDRWSSAAAGAAMGDSSRHGFTRSIKIGMALALLWPALVAATLASFDADLSFFLVFLTAPAGLALVWLVRKARSSSA
ncbi:hypothetical protein ACQP2E_28480 [Actinoplanes sp. CA-015351]|uniref:hypothetical protein n=1 Tax=Actinoplanes sp. CA-015351 TaxID=3239897 RepID=UPI003D976446